MSQAKIRVLVADDHPIFRVGLRNLISQQADMEVVGEASDGPEAVTQVLAVRPDVTLLDLRMPNLDGLQATKMLRSEGCVVPVIALSADPASVCRAEALAAGCDEFLSKPFAVSELVGVIRARLDPRLAPN